MRRTPLQCIACALRGFSCYLSSQTTDRSDNHATLPRPGAVKFRRRRMSRYTLTIALVILSACAALAQDSRTGAAATATNSTSTAANGKAINLESGTRLAAQLQNTLDVRKAKVGDQ